MVRALCGFLFRQRWRCRFCAVPLVGLQDGFCSPECEVAEEQYARDIA